jgi:hypothetical protein
MEEPMLALVYVTNLCTPELLVYVDGEELCWAPYEPSVAVLCALMTLEEKVPGASWEEYFLQLAEGDVSPLGMWTLFHLPEELSPELFLQALQDEYLADGLGSANRP